jgi:copper(I)-binding protein
MTQHAAAPPAQETVPGSPGSGGTPRAGLAGLARAALVPVACAAVLIGLLSAWVATGGAGTLRRVQVQFGLAAIPLPPGQDSAVATADVAPAYLVIKNLGGPDELLKARSPLARRIVLVRRGNHPSGTGALLPGLAIPGGGSVSLSPFTADIVLISPAALRVGEIVPLILTFRHAGQVTVEAMVSPPGTP